MRYKEYNVNRVLEKCIQLFWENGFRGCTVNDIVEATGVNRFSLYHEFENKEGILYNALRLYRSRYCEDKFMLLKQEGPLEEALKQFYLSFLVDRAPHQGCFFIHIGTELADTDPEIKKLVKAYLEEIENLFAARLLQEKRTLNNAKLYARHLSGLFCTSMSFCLIQTKTQKRYHITNGIDLIINKKLTHATSTK
jgi:TetR/AcrR family transcriptional regulator, transcriptional repressor for nem operon